MVTERGKLITIIGIFFPFPPSAHEYDIFYEKAPAKKIFGQKELEPNSFGSTCMEEFFERKWGKYELRAGINEKYA